MTMQPFSHYFPDAALESFDWLQFVPGQYNAPVNVNGHTLHLDAFQVAIVTGNVPIMDRALSSSVAEQRLRRPVTGIAQWNSYFLAVWSNQVQSFRRLLGEKALWPFLTSRVHISPSIDFCIIVSNPSGDSLLDQIAETKFPVEFMTELWRMIVRFPKEMDYTTYDWESLAARSVFLPEPDLLCWLISIDDDRRILLSPLSEKTSRRFFQSEYQTAIGTFIHSEESKILISPSQHYFTRAIVDNAMQSDGTMPPPPVNVLFENAGDKLSVMWRAASQLGEWNRVERTIGFGSGAILAAITAFGLENECNILETLSLLEKELCFDVPASNFTPKDYHRILDELYVNHHDDPHETKIPETKLESILERSVAVDLPKTFGELAQRVLQHNRFRHLHVLFYDVKGTKIVDISSEEGAFKDLKIMDVLNAALVPTLSLACRLSPSLTVHRKSSGKFNPESVIRQGYLNMGKHLLVDNRNLVNYSNVNHCPRTLAVEMRHKSPRELLESMQKDKKPSTVLKAVYCNEELNYDASNNGWQHLSIQHALSAQDMFTTPRSPKVEDELMKCADAAVEAFRQSRLPRGRNYY